MTKVSQGSNKGKKRGILLTLLLSYYFITEPFVVAIILWRVFPKVLPLHNIIFVYPFLILAILGVLNFVFALAIWKWKRWGVYGVYTSFVGSSIILLATVLANGHFYLFILPAVRMWLLTMAVLPLWRDFE